MAKFSNLHALVLMAAVLSGCGESQAWRDTVEQSLDKAISSMNDVSTDWRNELNQLEQSLPQEVRDTVRVEVANVISRSIAQTGVELRCDVDFVRKRVQQSLERIKASFLGNTPSTARPAFCQVVPIIINRSDVPNRVSHVEYYGYDFDVSDKLKVFQVNARNERIDVTSKLDRPTHYAMTLRFGTNGAQLAKDTERLVLEVDGEQLSSVGIFQPPCKRQRVAFTPGPRKFSPSKVGRGDREFDGHGPTIDFRIDTSPSASPPGIKTVIFMRAMESESDNRPKQDFTEFSGFDRYVIEPNPFPNGFEIGGIEIEKVSGGNRQSVPFKYRDSNTKPDTFPLNQGLVKELTFMGDGPNGNDQPNVIVTFNEIALDIVSKVNCTR